MTVTTNNRATDTVRLSLDSGPSRKAALDGAWWPRTTNAEAELPSLIAALGNLRGAVTHVLLSTSQWDLPHPRRLALGRDSARLGWYTAQPDGLVTVMTEFGQDRFDLLVVPPGATPQAAEAALSAAADADDKRRPAELLDNIERAG